MKYELHRGDCLDALRRLPENSVDSIVTDPPAGIFFMGKDWDSHKGGKKEWVAWMTEVMAECKRVLKPGGHALVWAIPRTSHWTGSAIEDAGFEIRDTILHVFGSGFPKSLNIGKQPKCQAWEGWGTALKPAVEIWWLARKPLEKKTVAENVLEYGTGGINVDGCRIQFSNETDSRVGTFDKQTGAMGKAAFGVKTGKDITISTYKKNGRFPSHLIHDGSKEVTDMFPNSKAGKYKGEGGKRGGIWSESTGKPAGMEYGDSGSAARFFQSCPLEREDIEASRIIYQAKASKKDRDEGLDGFEIRQTMGGGGLNNTEDDVCGKYGSIKAPGRNTHPTVKPTALMRYLCRLITPPKGTVLDPFMGSGSTGKGALLEGFSFIGIEREQEYFNIAMARIENTYEFVEKNKHGIA